MKSTRNFYNEMKRVFPDREPEDEPLEHEIFHTVYDLKKKSRSFVDPCGMGGTRDGGDMGAEVRFRHQSRELPRDQR